MDRFDPSSLLDRLCPLGLSSLMDRLCPSSLLVLSDLLILLNLWSPFDRSCLLYLNSLSCPLDPLDLWGLWSLMDL